jgi:hypothetical protein
LRITVNRKPVQISNQLDHFIFDMEVLQQGSQKLSGPPRADGPECGLYQQSSSISSSPCFDFATVRVRTIHRPIGTVPETILRRCLCRDSTLH